VIRRCAIYFTCVACNVYAGVSHIRTIHCLHFSTFVTDECA